MDVGPRGQEQGVPVVDGNLPENYPNLYGESETVPWYWRLPIRGAKVLT